MSTKQAYKNDTCVYKLKHQYLASVVLGQLGCVVTSQAEPIDEFLYGILACLLASKWNDEAECMEHARDL